MKRERERERGRERERRYGVNKHIINGVVFEHVVCI